MSLIYNVSVDWLLTGRGEKYLGPGREMDWEGVKDFLKQHPEIEEDKPGLYKMLEEADYREKYRIRENEAEYLARIELRGHGGKATPAAWARELELYRAEQRKHLLHFDLAEDERQVIKYMRLMSEDEKSQLRNFAEFLAAKKGGGRK